MVAPRTLLHHPGAAPAKVLSEAGVRLGETYPAPIVEHALARDRFLKIAASHLER